MNDQKKTKGISEIVFILDATGSMSSCIDALKDNIHTCNRSPGLNRHS